MTNFGQRPFMFDIDGYMKVRSPYDPGYQLGGLFSACLGSCTGQSVATIAPRNCK